MKVVAYDPFLTDERALALGVEQVDLDELLARADFITLHPPLTDKTRNILSAERLAKTKPGVRIINCARGGLVDEAALKDGLSSGHIAGAALDVFEVEPATANTLFGAPNFVCTPHLGASTSEAQENVALQVAEQMSDYLVDRRGHQRAERAERDRRGSADPQALDRARRDLGTFAGQVTDHAIEEVNITYNGTVSGMNTAALNAAAIAGLMKALNPDANMVSAPIMAKEHGVKNLDHHRGQDRIVIENVELPDPNLGLFFSFWEKANRDFLRSLEHPVTRACTQVSNCAPREMPW